MQSGQSPNWKAIVLGLMDEPHRTRLWQLLAALDPPTNEELNEFRKALELAAARAITNKVFPHPSFIHLLDDLAGVTGVIAVLRTLTLARKPGEKEET